MNPSRVIVAKHVKKIYQELVVLDVPILSIDKGIITTIVGPSGAGKSTLLHLLGTLLAPTQGEIWIEGMNIAEMNDRELSRFRNSHLGFVFQAHNLLPEFTALENVCLPAMIYGKKEKEYLPIAKELLNDIGLSMRYDHKPSQLSGGEQQRVSIARALINSPKIVMADEPTGNLDTKNAHEIHQLFQDMKNKYGHTFLIVTHNMDLAKQSDRIIEMKDGRIV